MAITGSYSINGLSAEAAYGVIDLASMSMRDGFAFVTVSIYASLAVYKVGAPPFAKVPMNVAYDGTTVPLDTFEAAAIKAPYLVGWSRVTTEVITYPSMDSRDENLINQTTAESSV
ncbi:hypothetical protein LLQ46_00560 [Rouxiella badensis]|uniref:hypothetical protein n=1 Tax=Rouxiella badensis TaxID=1646377 RepID=UPI001D15D0AE|nr:hypothetical protein [Rouxiella badensis]MCC3745339.1 hypothetical protein [Rouxiella badensis]